MTGPRLVNLGGELVPPDRARVSVLDRGFLYGEVFRRGAGARLRGSRAAVGGAPEASAEDVHWAGIKASAARWFARLDAEERRHLRAASPRSVPPVPRNVAIPHAGHRLDAEVGAVAARRKP